MGIFWDLLQEDELKKQQQQADSLEDRVLMLETELTKTKELLRKTLEALEKHVEIDIDDDGQLGVNQTIPNFVSCIRKTYLNRFSTSYNRNKIKNRNLIPRLLWINDFLFKRITDSCHY